MTAVRRATTKFGLTELALRAALALDRARAGAELHSEPVQAFAEALLDTADPEPEGAPFRFVEPGFYQPLQRLYYVQESSRASDVQHIQALMRTFSERLNNVAGGGAEDIDGLIGFCVALHQELIDELTAEDAFAVHEGYTVGDRTAPGFSAA